MTDADVEWTGLFCVVVDVLLLLFDDVDADEVRFSGFELLVLLSLLFG